MTKKLNKASRIIIAVASLSLIAAFFLPVWRIDLFAPQYPEGLMMHIWINKLTGDVDIINGLNHYIGMKHITTEMFPEFKYLPYVVVFYMLCGLTVAITGSRKLLFGYLILTVIGGVLAMYDFYQWGYDYGHNLDPTAPIQVPGLSYQPPLFGHKRLLNFDAYSFPSSGGWFVIVSAALAFVVWIVEWMMQKKINRRPVAYTFMLVPFILFLSSCSTEPQPLIAGKDNCSFCKMQVSDTRYGAEIITSKGKMYTFDDLHCLSAFIKGNASNNASDKIYVVDFNDPNNLMPAEEASFIVSPAFKTPMASHAIAVKNNEAKKFGSDSQAVVYNWEQLYKKFAEQ